MNENTFFRQATLAICSSLDYEIALYRCFQFLSKHIPVDSIYMNIHDEDSLQIKYLAMAEQSGGEKLDLRVDITTEALSIIRNEKQQVKFSNRPSDSLIENIKRELCNEPDSSIMVLLLEKEGHKLGAIDLIAKGRDRYTEEHARLLLLLKEPFNIAMSNALRHQELLNLKNNLADDNRYLNQELSQQSGSEIVGANNGLRHVMESVNQVASLNSTVLIQGETGVGKEIIANAIHRLSPRRDNPFIKVNCGAIPDTLIDSELFGHEKGSFTGAVRQKRGRFERADKGTIFLDEIGELPPEAQVRLLRVLQTREIERVGGTSSFPIDIRIICATHQNLEELMRKGKFREDLWFRINTFPIHIPPLRNRKEDISELVYYLINRKSMEMGVKTPVALAPEALSRLINYEWPGNVRELENMVERELIQNRSGSLLFDSLTNQRRKKQINFNTEAPMDTDSLDGTMSKHIKKVLNMTNGRVHGPGGAARILDINPHTLSKRMDKLGIAYGRKYKKTA